MAGTIDRQSPLPDLANSIATQGPGATGLTVERSAGYSFSSAIITVDAGRTAGFSGLKISNGNAGGMINTGTLTVSNSALKGNVAGDAGGGIMNWSGTLTVSASAVSGNSAAVGGGIFNLFGSAATIQQNSTLSGNSAEDGGGIDNGGTLTVSGSALTRSTAAGFDFACHHFAGKGGGLFSAASGTLTVKDSTLLNNEAPSGADLDSLGRPEGRGRLVSRDRLGSGEWPASRIWLTCLGDSCDVRVRHNAVPWPGASGPPSCHAIVAAKPCGRAC